MTVIRNWTGCAHFGSNARESLNQLTKTEGLLKKITVQETGGKRGGGGVLQPQLISPVTLSIPVSKNSAHLLDCIIYIYT